MNNLSHEDAQGSSSAEKLVRRYFVDEAGDLTLFDKRGRVQVGAPGVSKYFMVGVAWLPEPEVARGKLDFLRARLLSDPYFKGVPSMQPEARKTAVKFHANDDLPEVRREMFSLLPELGAKVQVALRRKEVLAREAQALFRYRRLKLQPNDVYDGLIMRLFRNLLHKADENRIVVARRGKAVRHEALQRAIARAKRNFAARSGEFHDKPTSVQSGYPSEHAGLQVVDYYLWALQRLYEAEQDRFFLLLRPGYRLIMDLDDTHHKPYGEWYSDSNSLTLEKIKSPRAD